jgi:hypothetical protein
MTKTIEIDLLVLHNHTVVARSVAALESILVLRDEANIFSTL